MIPIYFKECNDKIDSNGYSVYFHRFNNKEFVTCWKPTWRERISILIFGRVWLNMYDRFPGSCWIQGERTVFEKERQI
jgi:hypothetical protein